jgi:hemerythrin-like domain-containing protein
MTNTTDTEPTGLFLAHRAMLKDVDRVADLAGRLAATGELLAPKRATAVAAYVDDLADSIHHHHKNEDDVLWPVLERTCGAHVDLSELTEDHSVLDPKLNRIRTGTRELRAGRRVSAELAAELAELRDLLHEHIDEEERTIVPLIRRYVSEADWKQVEATIRKRGGKLTFEAPRVLAVCTPAELAEIRQEGGLPVAVMLKVLPAPFRRRERRVFA